MIQDYPENMNGRIYMPHSDPLMRLLQVLGDIRIMKIIILILTITLRGNEKEKMSTLTLVKMNSLMSSKRGVQRMTRITMLTEMVIKEISSTIGYQNKLMLLK